MAEDPISPVDPDARFGTGNERGRFFFGYKLHLAVDAAGCMIVAQTLIDQDVDDPSQVVSMPDQIEGEIAKVMADGAYDGAPDFSECQCGGHTTASGA